jgi:hypothetical protein
MSQTLSARPVRPPAGQGRRPSSRPAHDTARTGRAPSTSRQELEQICLDLFTHEGLEATCIEDMATAAGTVRRTFLGYISWKHDVVWGEFDEALGELKTWPLRCPDIVLLMTAIRRGVVAFNTYDPADEQPHRNRRSLMLNTDVHSRLRRCGTAKGARSSPGSRYTGWAVEHRPRCRGLSVTWCRVRRWLLTSGGWPKSAATC